MKYTFRKSISDCFRYNLYVNNKKVKYGYITLNIYSKMYTVVVCSYIKFLTPSLVEAKRKLVELYNENYNI